VESSIPGLADFAKVTVKECEEALGRLGAPDKYSRTPDEEGRRYPGDDGFHAKAGGEQGASQPVLVGIVTGDRALMRPSAGPLPVTDDNCQAINPLNDRRAYGWYGL